MHAQVHVRFHDLGDVWSHVMMDRDHSGEHLVELAIFFQKIVIIFVLSEEDYNIRQQSLLQLNGLAHVLLAQEAVIAVAE